MKHHQIAKQEVVSETAVSLSDKLKYERPILVCYGDVRDVTLGPTFGTSESGCEFARRVGNPVSCP